jgi:hypothetical protein
MSLVLALCFFCMPPASLESKSSVVSRVKFDDGTLPGPPHPQTPLPQGGEGRVELTTLAPLGERVARRGVFISRGETGEGVPSIVKSNVGHHTSVGSGNWLNDISAVAPGFSPAYAALKGGATPLLAVPP